MSISRRLEESLPKEADRDAARRALTALEDHLRAEQGDGDGSLPPPPAPTENGAGGISGASIYPVVRSLYLALAHRDRTTAEHSRRVAERIYQFANFLGFDRGDCTSMQLAGLLHDLGKIGVPDSILLKPAKLSPEEIRVMDAHHRMTIEIIRPTICIPQVIEAVDKSHGWYNGARVGFPSRGDEISMGARMLCIVDAFDAMTSDRVYRRAMTVEAALEELKQCAGSQFDPRLVEEFQKFVVLTPHSPLGGDWLGTGTLPGMERQAYGPFPIPAEFYARILNDLYDGVCFVSKDGVVLFWNDAAEQFTGYSAAELCERPWESLEQLQGAITVMKPGARCLLRDSMADGVPRQERMALRHKSGQEVPADVYVVPVVGGLGNVVGAAQLFRDARDRVSLETQCRDLAAQAMRDPLTGMPNRAQFDLRLRELVADHGRYGSPCSLIVADLDYFKDINDTFGHQCGDHVLKHFAQLLTSHMRPGELVARYGGEEFVVVLPHCPIEVAWRRAEAIRWAISNDSLPMLRGRRLTASFGVTEFQSSDNPDSFLRRADQALYAAKEHGRNRSIKIRANGRPTEDATIGTKPNEDGSIDETLYVASAGNMAMLKLDGFVTSHRARVLSRNEETMRLRVGRRRFVPWPPRAKKQVPVEITLTFRAARVRSRMSVHARLRPECSKPLSPVVRERCVDLLLSLRAYLQAD